MARPSESEFVENDPNVWITSGLPIDELCKSTRRDLPELEKRDNRSVGGRTDLDPRPGKVEERVTRGNDQAQIKAEFESGPEGWMLNIHREGVMNGQEFYWGEFRQKKEESTAGVRFQALGNEVTLNGVFQKTGSEQVTVSDIQFNIV